MPIQDVKEKLSGLISKSDVLRGKAMVLETIKTHATF